MYPKMVPQIFTLAKGFTSVLVGSSKEGGRSKTLAMIEGIEGETRYFHRSSIKETVKI